jgi:hypothetical protein
VEFPLVVFQENEASRSECAERSDEIIEFMEFEKMLRGQHFLDHLRIHDHQMRFAEGVGNDDIEVVIVMAIIVQGVPFFLVVTHPLGIMGSPSCNVR